MYRILPIRAPFRTPAPRGRKDVRWAALLGTFAAIVLVGAGLQAPWTAMSGTAPRPAAEQVDPNRHAEVERSREVRVRFDQAVIMLHARQYEHAAAALHRVIELNPTLPEAHVNMGFALLGMKRPDAARDFFEAATALRPGLANAYYGLAMAHEAAGNMPEATGAMKTFLHLSPAEDDFVRRARAALWEWQQPPPAPNRSRGP